MADLVGIVLIMLAACFVGGFPVWWFMTGHTVCGYGWTRREGQ